MPSNSLVGPFNRDQHAQFKEIDWILKVIAKDNQQGTMLDVGAHQGNVFQPFAKLGWQIHAFEPYGPLFNRLRQVYDNAENVHLDNSAISDVDGEVVSLYASYESDGISSLTPFRESHREIDRVYTKKLSTYLEEQEINHVDFLKIDTEGHDLIALKGFPWSRMQPRLIVCEFEDRKTKLLGYRMPEMAQFLADAGYTLLVSEWHPIVHYGIAHDWRSLNQFPTCACDENAWGNLVAIRETRDADALRSSADAFVEFSNMDFAAKSLHGADPNHDDRILGGLLEGMRLIIFGAGGSGRIAQERLSKIDCEILGFADSDPAKHGAQLDGKTIFAPEGISREVYDLIIIASDYAPEIYESLLEMGIPDGKIRVFYPSIQSGIGEQSKA